MLLISDVLENFIAYLSENKVFENKNKKNLAINKYS